MRPPFSRFLALSSTERGLLARAFLYLWIVDLGLWLLGFQRLVEGAPAPDAENPAVTSGENLQRAHTYAHWLAVASRHHVVRARCLHRSLALHHWLRRQGFASDFRIGVRKEAERISAHAWVEIDGQVVNDRASSITAFAVLRAPGERIGMSVHSRTSGEWLPRASSTAWAP